jgi:MerR family transcriptional regulator, heat shock protein HspR
MSEQHPGHRAIPDFAFGGAVPDDAPVYVISVAATLAGMHPQTLRQYDRLGLVSPGRAPGRGRRYSRRDIDLLRAVQRLSQEEGINLAGVKRILELETHVDALRARLAELQADLDAARVDAVRRERQVHESYRRDLVPFDQGAMEVWRPHPRQPPK